MLVTTQWVWTGSRDMAESDLELMLAKHEFLYECITLLIET